VGRLEHPFDSANNEYEHPLQLHGDDIFLKENQFRKMSINSGRLRHSAVS
jgi:hypothetical protein